MQPSVIAVIVVVVVVAAIVATISIVFCKKKKHRGQQTSGATETTTPLTSAEPIPEAAGNYPPGTYYIGYAPFGTTDDPTPTAVSFTATTPFNSVTVTVDEPLVNVALYISNGNGQWYDVNFDFNRPGISYSGGKWTGSFTVLSAGATYSITDNTQSGLGGGNSIVSPTHVGNGTQNVTWAYAPAVGDILVPNPDGVSPLTQPLPSYFTTMIINYNANGDNWITYSIKPPTMVNSGGKWSGSFQVQVDNGGAGGTTVINDATYGTTGGITSPISFGSGLQGPVTWSSAHNPELLDYLVPYNVYSKIADGTQPLPMAFNTIVVNFPGGAGDDFITFN